MAEQIDGLPYTPKENAAAGAQVIVITNDRKVDRYGFLYDVFNPRDKSVSLDSEERTPTDD